MKKTLIKICLWMARKMGWNDPIPVTVNRFDLGNCEKATAVYTMNEYDSVPIIDKDRLCREMIQNGLMTEISKHLHIYRSKSPLDGSVTYRASIIWMNSPNGDGLPY